MDSVNIEKLSELRRPFDADQIHHLPKGGVNLAYVGHAEATHRLLDVDPLWTWEPVAFDADGLPLMVRDKTGKPVGFWIRLTICGVTRLGYGSCAANKNDPEKELIGDAIRNAAMRFGVALDLWSKTDRAGRETQDEPPAPQYAPQRRQPQPQAKGDGPGIRANQREQLLNQAKLQWPNKETRVAEMKKLLPAALDNLTAEEAAKAIHELRQMAPPLPNYDPDTIDDSSDPFDNFEGDA